MHHKFCIVDKEETQLLLLWSLDRSVRPIYAI